MPNTKSAKKRLLTDAKRRMRNQGQKSQVRTALRQFLTLMDKQDVAGASEALKACFSALDKAAKINAISKNRASRTKARLAKRLATLQS